MALDRNQAGILFKIDVDAMDGAQQIELFKGVVSGASAEIRDQFSRMGSSVQQSFSGATRSITSFGEKLGEASTNQLRGFLGQFGMVGDAASDMIPALSGSSAAMLGLAGASVAAGAALASAAVYTMDYTGTVDDLAQMTNLTTETIQSLRLAATLSGQSFEETAQTAVIFQKKMEEAKNGNVELAATFSALGVDLNGPVDAAFRKTLESFGRVEDGSAKTKAGLDLFGKGATKLFGVMNQVGGSFDNLTARAKELGIVLDKDAINKANELADRWDILKLKMSGLTLDIGVKVIGWFDTLSDSIAKDVAQLGNLINMIDRFTGNPLSKLRQGLDSMPNQPAPTGSLDMFGRLQALRRPVVPVAPVAPTLDQSGAFSGPGIDPTTGLPEIELPKCKPPYVWDAKLQKCVLPKEKGGTAKAEKLVSLPSGDAIARAYEQYRQIIANEEKTTAAQREKLRVEAIDGEEARLRDRLIQQDESIARARAEATAGARTGRADVLNAIVANLEAEKALTQKAISEMETARVRAMIRFNEAAKANTEKRLADEKAKELALLQNFQAIRNAIRRGLEQTYVDVGFSPEASAAIVAQQEMLGRQLTMWEQVQVGAASFAQVIQDTMPSLAATMVNTSMAVSDALANMVSAFVQGRGSMRQVVGAFLDAALAPLRDYLMKKSQAHFALGLADLAMQNYSGAAKNFLAATALAGAAGLIKAGTSAISGGGVGAAAPIGPSGGGQFLSESRGGGGSTMREQGNRRSEPQVIIIRAETEPGVMVSKFVQDYRQNGEARGVLRRDLLGEY